MDTRDSSVGAVAMTASPPAASARAVELGFVDRGRVVINKGLKPGDKVIVTGQQSLRDGDRVRVR